MWAADWLIIMIILPLGFGKYMS